MRGLNNIVDLNTKPNFWLNDIGLFVPPTSISVHKEGLDYSIKALRTRVSTKILSGSGIYHAQINLTFPPDGLVQLHRFICQVRNNPFVYVENVFLKSSLNLDRDYCYFTLMGLNIINHPSSPGSFNVELDLRYFNHKVYDPNLGYFADWGYEVLDKNKIKTISFSPTTSNDEEGDYGVVLEEAEGRGDISKSIRLIENTSNISSTVTLKDTFKVIKPRDSKAYKRYSNYLQNTFLEENFGIVLSDFLKENLTLKKQIDLGNYGIHDVRNENGGVVNDLVILRNYIIEEMLKSSNTINFLFRNFAIVKMGPEFTKKLKSKIEDGVQVGMTEEAKAAKRKENFKKLSEDMDKISRDTNKINEKESEDYKIRNFKGVTLGAGDGERDIKLFRNNSKNNNYEHYPLTDSPTYTKINDVMLRFNNTRKLSPELIKVKPELSAHPVFASENNMVIHYIDSSNHMIVFKNGIAYRNLRSFFKIMNGDTLNKGDLIGYIEGGNDVEYINPDPKVIEYYLNDYEKVDNNVNIQGSFKTSDLQDLKNLKTYIDENYSLYTGVSGLENVLESTVAHSLIEYSKEDLSLILGKDINALQDMVSEEARDTSSSVVAVSGSLRNIVTSIPILGQEFPTHQFLGSIEPSYQINIIGKRIVEDQLPDTIEFIEKGRANSQFYAKNFSAVPDAGNFLIECLLTKLLGSYKQNSLINIKETKPSNETALPIIQHNFIVNSCDTFTIEGSPKAVGLNFRFSESKSFREENLRPVAVNTLPSDYKRRVLDILEGSNILNIKNPTTSNTNNSVTQKNKNAEWNMLNWKTKYYNSNQWYNKGRSSSKYKDGTLLTYFNSTEPNNDMNQDYNSYLLASEVLDKIQDFLNVYDSPINPKANKIFTLTFSSTFDIKEGSQRQTISNHFHGSAVDVRVSNMNAMEFAAIIEILMEEGYLKNPKLGGKTGLGTLGLGIYGDDADNEEVLMIEGDRSTGFIHIDLNASLKSITEPDGVTSINSDYKFYNFIYSKRRWVGKAGEDEFGEDKNVFWSNSIVKIKNRIKENVLSVLRKENTNIEKEKAFQWVKVAAFPINAGNRIVSYGYNQLSSEFVEKYNNVFDKVTKLGGVMTSGGGRRALNVLDRPILGMHNIGRAIDFAPYSGLAAEAGRDPNIKYLVIRDNPGKQNSLFTVWCIVDKNRDGFDQGEFDQAVTSGLAKKNYTFKVDLIKSISNQYTYEWTGDAFNLTQLMQEQGFQRIKPIDDYLTQGKFTGIEWWHYEIHEGLVVGKTTGLDEMLKLYSYKEASESHRFFGEASKLVWNGGIFA